MSNIDRDYDPTIFLEKNGVSLSHCGSSEFGLSRTDAIVFLDLLCRAGKAPLGIEVWTRSGSKFAIDSLDGWYSRNTSIEADMKSAREFVSTVVLSDDDLMTVQFD